MDGMTEFLALVATTLLVVLRSLELRDRLSKNVQSVKRKRAAHLGGLAA